MSKASVARTMLGTSIYNRIISSSIVKFIYNQKNYLEIGSLEATFLSTKMSMIMTFTYLAVTYFAWKPDKGTMVTFILIAIFSLWLFGFLYRNSGLYTQLMQTQADMNPVAKEILDAARIIKRWEVEENAQNRYYEREKEKPHCQVSR